VKKKANERSGETAAPMEALKQAFHDDDAVLVRKLLERMPEIRAKINEPVAAFDSPVITGVRSREMLDVLLDAGADINAKSRWWAGGFGLLHSAKPDLAAYAIQRGAVVDIHAAARLGMLERVRELIASDSALVHARGGDGQTPLHFASNIEVAEFLLEHGADIDARDVDHESTAAQWMIRERQPVAAFLVKRGCKTDILMAAALGQEGLVRRHLELDPDCIRMRVSNDYFQMINPKSGGTIYQWTLGWYVSAHDVAKQFGHERVLALLNDHSPGNVNLAVAAWQGDEATVAKLLAQDPGLLASLSAADRRLLAHAARNNDLAAVRTMLKAGWPLDVTSQHGATPLHWAAFHGNAAMTRELLRYRPSLEVKDADFNGSPLGWAIYGSEHGWHCEDGDYVGTVEALIAAGAKIPDESQTGAEAVKEALKRHRSK
jgi:ankyrin repeat protein